ncbi:hypothetical protein [Candidatus Liberibacter brunswickensis]
MHDRIAIIYGIILSFLSSLCVGMPEEDYDAKKDDIVPLTLGVILFGFGG